MVPAAEKVKRLALLFYIVPLHLLKGQLAGPGSWNIIQLKLAKTETVSFFGEAQLRSLQFYKNFHYYEYKAGIQVKIRPELSASFGAGNYQTYREGGNFRLPKNNNELRIWPQLVFSYPMGIRLKMEHRYRAEFRFAENFYRNRFRYRLGASIALGKKEKGKKPLVLAVGNELFFTDRPPYFERNRAQVTLQFKATENTAIQLGYLYQFDYKINDETGRNFFQVGYYIDINKGRSPIIESGKREEM